MKVEFFLGLALVLVGPLISRSWDHSGLAWCQGMSLPHDIVPDEQNLHDTPNWDRID